LPVYAPGAGFKDVTASLMANYHLNKHMILSVSGNYTSILGNDADSPVVAKKQRPAGLFSIAYRF